MNVTFFCGWEGLADEKGINLSSVCREAVGEGYEIGLHGWSHPKSVSVLVRVEMWIRGGGDADAAVGSHRLEARSTHEEIDEEYRKSIAVVVTQKLGIRRTCLFILPLPGPSH